MERRGDHDLHMALSDHQYLRSLAVSFSLDYADNMIVDMLDVSRMFLDRRPKAVWESLTYIKKDL